MMRERAALYMRTLAQTGSITRAAEQLYVTPSALSKYITALERDTGNVLFSRKGNHFTLTHEGKRCLDWLTRLESISDQMDAEMSDLSHQKSGRIRIGIQTTLPDFFMREILPEFREAYPGINIAMYEEAGHSLLRRLRHLELDFAISTHPPEEGEYHIERLIDMQQVLIVYKDHPLVAQARPRAGFPHPWIDISLCEGEGFILMHPDQGPRRDTDRMLSPIAGKFRTVMEVRTMRTMLEAVENGLGMTLTSDGIERLYANNWQNLVKLSYGEELSPTTFYLFYDPQLHQSIASQALMAIIREKFIALEKEIRSSK